MSTETTNDTSSDQADNAVAQAEQANAEVQAASDKAEAKGFIGWSPAPDAGHEHSLLTGPHSPLLVPDNRTRFEQPVLPEKES